MITMAMVRSPRSTTTRSPSYRSPNPRHLTMGNQTNVLYDLRVPTAHNGRQHPQRVAAPGTHDLWSGTGAVIARNKHSYPSSTSRIGWWVTRTGTSTLIYSGSVPLHACLVVMLYRRNRFDRTGCLPFHASISIHRQTDQ